MNPLVLLTLLSVVGVAALFLALACFLVAISRTLEEIGGPTTRFVTPVDYLAKIRLGVRAIERETDFLAPYVTTLNTGLRAIRDGLLAIDTNLTGLIAAVTRQGARR